MSAVRNRLNSLTLNVETNDPDFMSDSMSAKSSSSRVKKRRYRELDSGCWSIDDSRGPNTDILRAT